jgi:hypothetical protein
MLLDNRSREINENVGSQEQSSRKKSITEITARDRLNNKGRLQEIQPESPSSKKKESEADLLLSPGQKHLEESSSAMSPQDMKKDLELMKRVLYDDGQVKLDFDGLTIRRYYFPTGKSKHVPYAEIKGVDERRMGLLTGKLRLWGGDFRYWLPRDLRRPLKQKALALDVGQRVKPTITPDDPDRVLAILQECTDR